MLTFSFLNSVNQVSPKVRKTLKLFRLLQINNGVFIKLNKVMTSPNKELIFMSMMKTIFNESCDYKSISVHLGDLKHLNLVHNCQLFTRC